MTKQKETFSPDTFESDLRHAVRLLKTDIWGIGRVLRTAKIHAPDLELEIRREIRPLAVELLYMVIGTPKTFEEVLEEMDNEEDEHGD